MIRLRKELGRDIPEGHNFPIDGGPTLRAETIEELADKIRDYRICNGLPLGNPIEEITQLYAVKYPWSVEQCDEVSADTRDLEQDRAYEWINSMWRQAYGEHASGELIELRQQKCMQCPFRKELVASDSPARREMERRVFLLARGNLGPDELGWCSCHHWDNRLACLLPNPTTVKDPPECWIHDRVDH
jgi:hypothetical protein